MPIRPNTLVYAGLRRCPSPPFPLLNTFKLLEALVTASTSSIIKRTSAFSEKAKKELTPGQEISENRLIYRMRKNGFGTWRYDFTQSGSRIHRSPVVANFANTARIEIVRTMTKENPQTPEASKPFGVTAAFEGLSEKSRQ